MCSSWRTYSFEMAAQISSSNVSSVSFNEYTCVSPDRPILRESPKRRHYFTCWEAAAIAQLTSLAALRRSRRRCIVPPPSVGRQKADRSRQAGTEIATSPHSDFDTGVVTDDHVAEIEDRLAESAHRLSPPSGEFVQPARHRAQA